MNDCLQHNSARPRVILVDDDDAVRASVIALLQKDFHVLCEFGDGETVLNKAAELEPDIFLLDICLPGMDGIELLQQLAAEKLDATFLFLTSQTDRRIVVTALESGASGLVDKSRAASDLVMAMKCVLVGGIFVSPSLADR